MREHSCALQNGQAHTWQVERKLSCMSPKWHTTGSLGQLRTKPWSHRSTVGPASSVLSFPVPHQAEEHHSSLEGKMIYFYHQSVKDNIWDVIILK